MILWFSKLSLLSLDFHCQYFMKYTLYKYHFWMNEELLFMVSMISSNSLQINFFSFKGMLLVNKKQVDVQAKNLFDWGFHF